MTNAQAPWARSSSTWVIAEVGVNHDGDLSLAHELVDVAADAGADCVKFQTFETDRLVARTAEVAPYQRRAGQHSQAAMLERLALPPSAWPDLMHHATERGLTFLSTPFDRASAEMLAGLGVEALKVPSGELTNLPHIRELAGLGRPLILSTGMATLNEVHMAVEAAAPVPAMAILHCVSAYPAPATDANLLAIRTLADEFGVPVGWSDHTVGSLTALGAVALGASVLEKHITLDTGRSGPDHAASADPHAFNRYVEDVRTLERAMGDGVKAPQRSEEENRVPARRAWHAVRDLPAGHVVEAGDAVALRPAHGIAPSESIEGRRTVRDLREGEAITTDALSPTGENGQGGAR